MQISTIYQRYNLTPTLQEHMFRAAAVGAIITESWKDKSILDKHAVISTLLLHDTANIIKFDLEGFPQLLGTELPRIEHWKAVQKDFIKRYGTNEHQAIVAIAREIDVSEYILFLVDHMGAPHLYEAVESTDWNQKICCYSDFRSGPFGVLSVNERFDDLIKRYKDRNHHLSSVEKMEQYRNSCLELEKQLQFYLSIDLQKITDQTVKNLIAKLRSYEIQRGH
jgi:hypothetical protein